MSDASSLPRRDFLKLFAAGTVTAAAASCRGQAGRELAPLLIPERELPTGAAFWSRGLCRQCDAGCGVLVKRMEAVVPLTIDGKPFRQSRLVAKKLEGNPDHPLNGGGLCARGQAGLELTYHPLRLSTPLRRVGSRGGALFKPTSWSDALAELQRKLATAGAGGVAWLGRPLRATEAEVVSGWLGRHGAAWWEYRAFPAPRAEADAARLALLPRADFVLSFGNFLESWPAQAALTRAYARFRRERRGVFVQVEPRLSLTAANADRWIPVRPGSEGTFALGVAAELARLRARGPGSAPAPPWLGAYAPASVAQACDVSAAQVVDTARALAAARTPLVVGGPNAYAYPHAEFQAGAIAYLARLAGAPEPAAAGEEARLSRVTRPAPGDGAPAAGAAVPIAFGAPLPRPPRLLLVHEANPVFSAPPDWRFVEWLEAIPEIVALGTLPDETVLHADLVLPLSTTLESWADDEQHLPTGELVATLNPPAMRPLHDTRSLIGIVAALAGEAVPEPAPPDGDDTEPATVRHWQRLQAAHVPGEAFPAFWQAAVARGGFWPASSGGPAAAGAAPPLPAGNGVAAAGAATAGQAAASLTAAPAPAADAEYPYHLRVYESPVWGDGAGSWLTWLQELPDPTTSAMWSSWVEVHPRLAARLGLVQGDGVWVESRAGRIELPVFLYPGLHPETVAIPAGQGHSAPGAPTNRGGNAYALLTGERDPGTGALAWEATRVRLSPSGRRPPLPLFGRSLQNPITHR